MRGWLGILTQTTEAAAGREESFRSSPGILVSPAVPTLCSSGFQALVKGESR